MSRVRVPLFAPFPSRLMTACPRLGEVAAIVLAGGAAPALGGGDKPLLDLAGTQHDRAHHHRTGYPPYRHQRQWRSCAVRRLRRAGPGRRRLRRRRAARGRAGRPGVGRRPGRGCAADGARRYAVHSPGLAAALAPPPACAASNGRAHHLVALWPLACRDNLRRSLSTPGRRDIVYFASAIGMRRIDFAVAKWDPFLNVNTPEDLALARTIAEGET